MTTESFLITSVNKDMFCLNFIFRHRNNIRSTESHSPVSEKVLCTVKK